MYISFYIYIDSLPFSLKKKEDPNSQTLTNTDFDFIFYVYGQEELTIMVQTYKRISKTKNNTRSKSAKFCTIPLSRDNGDRLQEGDIASQGGRKRRSLREDEGENPQ